jgi:two-component system cell cycle response regulator DivK
MQVMHTSPLTAPNSAVASAARILLVEDNVPGRYLMDDYLKYAGFTVLCLPEGKGFDAAMQEFRPHLVLLDLKLPDVDGYTLLQQMNHHPEWRKIPVIVVSAFAFQADQRRALSLGARCYFVKPIKLLKLRQAIEQELSLSTPPVDSQL